MLILIIGAVILYPTSFKPQVPLAFLQLDVFGGISDTVRGGDVRIPLSVRLGPAIRLCPIARDSLMSSRATTLSPYLFYSGRKKE
ncbi:hypothetical protein Dda3937_00928 [Dickeya dadantii 3937]|uniref:Uncharacterized protein n=1 Tax=Dickeya dadantii (strain 3937) TaxID=198628 RepID=E0SCV1_DICD3|nr:hypothetical protein Dda3937_00928 [Dickeya dadantii 3937]